MSSGIRACAMAALLAGTVLAQNRDLRDRYNTSSLEAAEKLNTAIGHSEAGRHKEALAAVNAAIEADGGCQMAWFMRALIAADLGDLDESMTCYRKALSDDVRRTRDVSATAATNLGLLLGKLKQYDESSMWFSRAVVEDYDNRYGQRGMAYRNMAINLSAEGRHLSAAYLVMLARRDNAKNVGDAMVREFLGKLGDPEETARLLRFPDPSAAPAKRTAPARTVPAEAKGEMPAAAVGALLADPAGRYILALGKNAEFHRIDLAAPGGPTGVRVPLSARPAGACLAGGSLWAAFAGPNRIERIDPLTGRVAETHSLGTHAPPATLAVFPTRRTAYFPVGRLVYLLDLAKDAVIRTDIPGEAVAGHPNEQYVFSYLKPERQGGGVGHVIIDGRPVFIQPRTIDWRQTTLFKSVAVPGGLLLAETRDNAASNARLLTVSPDGRWVSVMGTGGWRPVDRRAGRGGYGIAAFGTHNLEHLQAFLADSSLHGAAFNPVTGQVVVVRDGIDARIRHLADPSAEPLVIEGKFNGVSVWSGDGRWLVLAAAGEAGVKIFSNELTPDETRVASTWYKEIKVSVPAADAGAPAGPPVLRPLDALARFAVGSPTAAAVRAELAKAAKQGGTTRAPKWRLYPEYVKDAAVAKAVEAAREALEGANDPAVAVYHLKQVLKGGDSVPAKFYLAEAYRRLKRFEEAEPLFLAVVKADAGRTELTPRALTGLAAGLADAKKNLAALRCLAAALMVDRADPAVVGPAVELMKTEKMDAEAAAFRVVESDPAGGAAAPAPALPKLPPAPAAAAKRMTAAEVFRAVAASVVTIETGSGGGSGVCIAEGGYVLTNQHVVGDSATVTVQPFTIRAGRAVRLPRIRAEVVYRSAARDVAVLKLASVPEGLKPVPVAGESPAPGEKVFAVGSPLLGGREVLEQTISEGLISGGGLRVLDGNRYLQHSAAVNPGNSGGPLLDESGRIVGLVTLKARLENVSFAIPAESLREVFSGK